MVRNVWIVLEIIAQLLKILCTPGYESIQKLKELRNMNINLFTFPCRSRFFCSISSFNQDLTNSMFLYIKKIKKVRKKISIVTEFNYNKNIKS